MNSIDFIADISKMEDTSKITDKTKYVNISIDNISEEAITYLLKNGANLSYSDSINDKKGFIYASFDVFKRGEKIISSIINNMPSGLSDLEKARYLYIALGKIISSDINILSDKNETVSFNRISEVNNIWSSLVTGKATDINISKLYMYLCQRVKIKCELASSNIKGNIVNKVYINQTFILVDLSNDIHNIQGNFMTQFFDKYNDDKVLDKKVNYIREEYTDYYIDMMLNGVNYEEEDILKRILILTSRVMDISKIGPLELAKIYQRIFDKYVPNYDIKINNLFAYNGLKDQEHFVVFSYNNTYYSFNYNKKIFISIDMNTLIDNIKNDKVGVYAGEDFSLMRKEFGI